MRIECKKCHGALLTEEHPEFSGFCPECGSPMAGKYSGKAVDEFEILYEIGRGNNGAVFLARQLGVGREAALKLMLREYLSDPAAIAAFFAEARAVACLNHPNIVQAIAAGRMEDGNFYFAMELIDGPSVESIIDSSGPLPYREALRIAALIARAMASAWNRRGLIHGDIKPANIIMHRGKQPKLADLGLAQFRAVTPREIMATPLYAPPEVIRADFANMSFASDLYSFGASVYEMFSGEPPFPGTDIDLVLKMQLEQAPVTLSEKMGLFNPAVSDFVDQMLAKAAVDRPQSWDAVADFFAAACERDAKI
ncbi:MAG: serine/threonine protein kinase [Victivallaceae bacterium]|nr:serine/threonine-protein kinase [Victivallaceae bacterium]